MAVVLIYQKWYLCNKYLYFFTSFSTFAEKWSSWLKLEEDFS